MRVCWRVVTGAVGVASLLATGGYAASSVTNEGAFSQREDTMRKMGRAFYLGVGRVVKGRAELGPATVTAAEAVASLSGALDTLFPPGSDVADSKIKPQIFLAKPHVDDLVAKVQAAASQLVRAVKNGDKTAIAASYNAVNDACESCHTEFRKSE
jgi:cytochrome c556